MFPAIDFITHCLFCGEECHLDAYLRCTDCWKMWFAVEPLVKICITMADSFAANTSPNALCSTHAQ